MVYYYGLMLLKMFLDCGLLLWFDAPKDVITIEVFTIALINIVAIFHSGHPVVGEPRQQHTMEKTRV